MTDLDRKLIDAFLITIAIVALSVVIFRMSSCNEYQSRLTGRPALEQKFTVPSLCDNPPCVERVDPEAKPK